VLCELLLVLLHEIPVEKINREWENKEKEKLPRSAFRLPDVFQYLQILLQEL